MATKRYAENEESMHSTYYNVPQLWDMPDEVIFLIISFIAGPTRRAFVICHSLALLGKAAKHALLDDESKAAPIWELVLQEDYGAFSSQAAEKYGERKTRRRLSKRLKTSVLQQVEKAHKLIKDNTEIAYFYISEMCSGSSSPTGSLTKVNLCKIMDEYGPYLRINEVVSSGGLILVEVCRARKATENSVLNCVKELIERYGAHPDRRTAESKNSQQTALCVTAVRGMSKVVSYLLKQNADKNITSSGRFRLHTTESTGGGRKVHRSLRCDDVTPLQFATAMREAEAKAGATQSTLKGLDRSIKLLS